MESKYKEKLVEKQSIYVDCKRLLEWLYDVRWKVNRKDRASLFNAYLIPDVLRMISHFKRGYRFREERLKSIDEFLYYYDDVNSLLELASSKKLITEKDYSSTFIWLVRIEESVKNWRASARKAKQSGVASNYGGAPENEDNSRGGDGFI